MYSIYKYELTPPRCIISIPKGAKILDFQIQHKSPCLWALIDTEQKENMDLEFVFICTGEEIPAHYIDKTKYLKTFQLVDGSIIVHLFQIVSE